MACSAAITKGLNSLDYDTNVRSYLTKELFLLLKKGKNAFPMGKAVDATQFDGAFRGWLLAICKVDKDLGLTSLDALNTLQRAETVEELQTLRAPVALAKDNLVSAYGSLLEAVYNASKYVPNPALSSVLSSIGLAKPVNQYYKQVHDGLFTVQKGYVSMLDSMLQRIDRKTTNVRNAAMREARTRSNAATAVRDRAYWNSEARKYGLPAGTPAETILALRRTRSGGKRKTIRRKNKGRKTRKN